MLKTAFPQGCFAGGDIYEPKRKENGSGGELQVMVFSVFLIAFFFLSEAEEFLERDR